MFYSNCEKYIVLWAGKTCCAKHFHEYSSNIRLRKENFSRQCFKKISQTLLLYYKVFYYLLKSIVFKLFWYLFLGTHLARRKPQTWFFICLHSGILILHAEHLNIYWTTASKIPSTFLLPVSSIRNSILNRISETQLSLQKNLQL